MNIQELIDHEISLYHTDNIKELIDIHNIQITYNDQMNKDSDSSLLVINKNAYITLKSELDPLYENFLLAHELGHYLLHYDDNISFYFLLKTRKNALEREANEFAFRILFHDININEIENIEFVLKEKGIPIQIWYSLQDIITL